MATAKTLPVWVPLADFNREHFTRMAASSETQDLVVVGAGVSGLSTALCAAREGRRVLVIDRQGVGEGESLRTTAHLASALDDRFTHLARWHGQDGARLAADSHAAAIDWIERFVAVGDDCGFARVPAYLFSHDGTTESDLREEMGAAREAGLEAEWVEQVPGLPQLGAAIRFGRQARIDMGRYLRALAFACEAIGVRFGRADVRDVQGGSPVRIELHEGGEIRAEAVVLATNVPFHARVPIHTKQAPYRTYVVAAELDATSIPDALLWDDGDPYHYVRLVDHPDGSGMLAIIGGEDHKTGQDDDPTAYVRLQEWARERLPGLGTFTYAWSGQVLEPADGLAFIGADPAGEDNVYIITGDSGNGVTHGTLAGLLLADLLQGRPSPWTKLYDPSRKQLRASGGWLHENANVAAQYRDWMAPGEGKLDDLARGEGTVLRRGLHRIAVYRSGDGDLVAHSALCPHLGCSVRWSPQEKSFDCPCHGSRFDARTGAVLNGPANEPLQPYVLSEADRGTPA